MAPTAANFADPVPEGDPVGAPGALHRTLVDSEIRRGRRHTLGIIFHDGK